MPMNYVKNAMSRHARVIVIAFLQRYPTVQRLGGNFAGQQELNFYTNKGSDNEFARWVDLQVHESRQ